MDNITNTSSGELEQLGNLTINGATSARSSFVIFVHGLVRWTGIPMFLLAIFGNAMIVIVMKSRRNKKLSCSTYFSALAVSDSCLVIQLTLNRWCFFVFNVNIYDLVGGSTVAVNFVNISMFMNYQMSSWLLVAINMDRIICIAFPLQSKTLLTTKIARLIVACLFVTFATINSVSMVMLIDLFLVRGNLIAFTEKVTNGQKISVWMDLVLTFALPFVCIVIGTLIIVTVLTKNVSGMVRTTSVVSRNRSVMVILVCTNIVFLLTISPIRIVSLLRSTGVTLSWRTEDRIALMVLAEVVHDLNPVLNFYVYILSGRRLRQEVKEMLCGCKLSHHIRQLSSGRSSNMASAPIKQHEGKRPPAISTLSDVVERQSRAPFGNAICAIMR